MANWKLAPFCASLFFRRHRFPSISSTFLFVFLRQRASFRKAARPPPRRQGGPPRYTIFQLRFHDLALFPRTLHSLWTPVTFRLRQEIFFTLFALFPQVSEFEGADFLSVLSCAFGEGDVSPSRLAKISSRRRELPSASTGFSSFLPHRRVLFPRGRLLEQTIFSFPQTRCPFQD